MVGKEGSADDGEGMIQRLWNEANSHFAEIEHLAKRDEAGNIVGIWGAMSDFPILFNPGRKIIPRELTLQGWR